MVTGLWKKQRPEEGIEEAGTLSGHGRLLVTTGDGYVMTPHDWKLLLRMILSAMQYAVFMTEYRDLATAKALDNFTGSLNHIGVNELVVETVDFGVIVQQRFKAREHLIPNPPVVNISDLEVISVLSIFKMKAGDATIVSESLDTFFHFFHYEYPNTKCLVKQKCFQGIIQQGKNEEKKIA
ncbi:endogenous retrovirus group k member 8 gag poly [Limosa lapponica baueri]|uniref:Endogenous retrovirus group k member 8 gag poly n=1 Tax=Limosa lapponica baueri TaxID=1758121 RepID=A0A2I0URB9_LIMLA|nr:endogenous retrovirus group k member 8 gag poly [Limosa lapponica baueri]